MSKDKKYFLLFGFITILIYGQSLFGGFVFDDRGILEHQSLLSSSANVLQVLAYPYWTYDAGLYRPTSLFSYLLNLTIFGSGAWSFHLLNLSLYFGIGVLIYLLLKKLFEDERLALFSALLFLVLPIHTEVVANITGRLELLALFFSLLALWELLRRGDTSYFWPLLYMLLAIGSKETAIATVPIAIVILLIKRRSVFERGMIGMGLGVGFYLFFRFLVLGPTHFLGVETSLIENPLLFVSAHDRVATALSIFWMYLSKSIWPVNLCSDYSFNQIKVLHSFLNFGASAGLMVLLGLSFSIVYFLRRRRALALGAGFMLFGFIVVSNIPFPIGTIAGERLFFYPSLGLAIMGAYLINSLFTIHLIPKRVKVTVFVAILAIYSLLSLNRQAVWLSEERLFINAAECAPESVLSLSNLGTVYYFKGDFKKAAEALEKSREIKPIYSKGLNNLGLVYWQEGRLAEAKQMYYESLKQKYPYDGAIENLVLLNLSSNDQNGALRWLRIEYPNVGDFALRNLFEK